jgi:hypothetical protein
MKKLLLSSIILLFAGLTGNAQAVTPVIANAGGSSYQNPSSYFRYFDWSIGELSLISTVAPADSSVVLYQGVLQPCTEKPGFSPLNANFNPEDVVIMPNPTTGKFEVNFFVRENGIMTLELMDATGRLIEKRSFRYNGNFRTEQYDITHLPAAVYLIGVTLTPDVFPVFNINQLVRHSSLKLVKLR